MRSSALASTCLLAVSLCGTVVAGQQPDAGLELTLSRAPGMLRTGDAVLITVETSARVTAVEGDAFGRPVMFWPGAGEHQWYGLIGIDIDAGAGKYEVDVRATSERGRAQAGMTLPVERRRVETRRIRVAERFANPPQEEGPRIKHDAELLARTLAHSLPSRLWRGGFAAPVPGSSTSSFGRLTVLNDVPRGRHRGVDFQAMEGTPVVAPNAGVVVLATDLYFTGNTVILDHGAGLFSLLAHLSRIDVEEGRYVAAGDLIGLSGSTGRVTGPHLHWTMRLGEATVDPISLISALRQVN
jgi:murein DD-endopeptidase MepM/ murein hydrolase activator NlpD